MHSTETELKSKCISNITVHINICKRRVYLRKRLFSISPRPPRLFQPPDYCYIEPFPTPPIILNPRLFGTPEYWNLFHIGCQANTGAEWRKEPRTGEKQRRQLLLPSIPRPPQSSPLSTMLIVCCQVRVWFTISLAINTNFTTKNPASNDAW